MSNAQGRDGTLPTFITIGAMKCGTSSLHNYLSLHPEIGMSGIKELDFFLTDDDLAKGVGWYASQFPANRTERGESSPNYSKKHAFPGVAARMHALLPDIKLIYMVRNPADRAVSHYVHSYATGDESRPIEQVFSVLEDNNYVETGRYAYQIRDFLEIYGESCILIIKSDDLLENRRQVLENVFKFLGVSQTFSSDDFDRLYNEGQSRIRRHTPVRRLKQAFPKASKSAKTVLPDWLLSALTSSKIQYPVLDTKVRRRLIDFYEDDIRDLERHLRQRLPAWYS